MEITEKITDYVPSLRELEQLRDKAEKDKNRYWQNKQVLTDYIESIEKISPCAAPRFKCELEVETDDPDTPLRLGLHRFVSLFDLKPMILAKAKECLGLNETWYAEAQANHVRLMEIAYDAKLKSQEIESNDDKA